MIAGGGRWTKRVGGALPANEHTDVNARPGSRVLPATPRHAPRQHRAAFKLELYNASTFNMTILKNV
jgi:hypothetical protein